jgi:predicted ATPase
MPLCGNYATAKARSDELFALSDEKGASFWKAQAMCLRVCLLALTGDAADAVHMITSGLSAYHSTGATVFTPWYLSTLAGAHAKLGQLDDAWRCIDEAVTTTDRTKEMWSEAEVHRIGGEIALKSPQADTAKAHAYFERALAIARQQQAKSWELRASMSLARLWRDRGKSQQARELLAPVYGWFTEGFDTRDLKDAKALLQEFGGVSQSGVRSSLGAKKEGCASGAAEMGSCPTDATREGCSRRAVRKFAAMPTPERLRYQLSRPF